MDTTTAIGRTTTTFDYNKNLWMKFFIVKNFEYILLWFMIGIHLYSSAYGDDFPWALLIVGTEIGFCIIISVLLFIGLFKTRLHPKIHGLLNLIGCVLFIVSGVRIIYKYKDLSNDFQRDFSGSCPILKLLYSINLERYEDAISKFKIILPLAIDNNNVKEQIEQMFKFGFTRGVLSIIVGISLLLDSFLVFKEIY